VGPSVRPWIGDKLDTTRLGLTTMLLSVVALAAAITLRRSGARVSGQRLAVAVALTVPGLVGCAAPSTWPVACSSCIESRPS